MKRSINKFVAVFIAVWLPLFSGNALAVSVAVHAIGGAGHAVVAHESEQWESEQCPHHAPVQDQSADLQDQQDSSCGSTGICHLACCGYIAAVSITVAGVLPFALTNEPSPTRFQSVALTPLDHPPLARA